MACVFHRGSHDALPVEPAETHPDKLVDFWEWLVENRTQVSLAIIAALGIGMIAYVKKVSRLQDEEAAAEEFLAASNPDFEIEGVTSNLTGSAPGATRSAALPTLGQAAAAKNNRMNRRIVFLIEKLIRLA